MMTALQSVPTPNADINQIFEFALEFNGYEYNPNIGKIANQLREHFQTNPNIFFKQDLDLLRGCLFYEQRRFRHYGWLPEGEELEYIIALMDSIRLRWMQGTGNTLAFNIGGHFGPSFKVVIISSKVHYLRDELGRPPFERVLSPSRSRIEAFFKFFQTRCANWKREYFENTTDGTDWDLAIRTNELMKNCHGSNAYPENFQEFISELKKLTGGLKLY